MGKKILCIDDSENLLQILKKRFEFELPDVEIFTAQSGEEGIKVARDECPDLILLDITMPDMNGDEVLQRLKHPHDIPPGQCPTVEIPILILTAHGPEERNRFLTAGATDYISSPFDTGELVEKIKNLLN